jgi:hypothetical protein
LVLGVLGGAPFTYARFALGVSLQDEGVNGCERIHFGVAGRVFALSVGMPMVGRVVRMGLGRHGGADSFSSLRRRSILGFAGASAWK